MADADALLPVLKIQRFSTHDGPSIRTAVYTKLPLTRMAQPNRERLESAMKEVGLL